MRDRTIWEREIKWPRSGPIHWLTMYVLVVICAGFALWLGLSFSAPTTPDSASGETYEVPGGRRAPPFYVDRIDAYALRFATAHLGVLIVVGAAVKIWNAGARTPKKPD